MKCVSHKNEEGLASPSGISTSLESEVKRNFCLRTWLLSLQALLGSSSCVLGDDGSFQQEEILPLPISSGVLPLPCSQVCDSAV